MGLCHAPAPAGPCSLARAACSHCQLHPRDCRGCCRGGAGPCVHAFLNPKFQSMQKIMWIPCDQARARTCERPSLYGHPSPSLFLFLWTSFFLWPSLSLFLSLWTSLFSWPRCSLAPRACRGHHRGGPGAGGRVRHWQRPCAAASKGGPCAVVRCCERGWGGLGCPLAEAPDGCIWYRQQPCAAASRCGSCAVVSCCG